MVDFGQTLKELRQQAGLTQKQLAEKMGITASVVSYYELSERIPSPETLIKLSQIFNVSTDYLLGIEKGKCRTLDITGLNKDSVELLQHTIAVLRQNQSQK